MPTKVLTASENSASEKYCPVREHSLMYISIIYKPNKILKSLELLFEAIYNTMFFEDDLEKEKHVVLTEAKEFLDNDDSFVYLEMLKTLFPNTTMSKFFFGTEETMKNITKMF